MGAGIGMLALGIIGLIAVVALGLVLWGIGVYNSLTRSRIAAQGSFSGIDVELKRRHDLVPNLVNTVKGYAAHEKQTFESVISARAAAVEHVAHNDGNSFVLASSLLSCFDSLNGGDYHRNLIRNHEEAARA